MQAQRGFADGRANGDSPTNRENAANTDSPADDRRLNVWAVIVAGGSGARFGGYKQFADLCGRPVVEWSIDVACRTCQGVVLVVPESVLGETYVLDAGSRCSAVVAGGPTRTASVRNGLQAVPANAQVVLVHDAARPLAGEALWKEVIEAVRAGADAAVPCIPVTDTVKQRDDDGRLVTLDRSRLVASQTPQGFAASALRRAHSGDAEATDDAALVEAGGGRVVEVAGASTNLKVTSTADMALAGTLLRAIGCRA
ncbi:MAG TPA: 2-C-methyl-D-erythritol 4-phosphate cytidylyltransferase [Acidimicrobiales bacterium]|nr:2-C-methyl-D-erythritol 4-phosphate cytidylyltransferase [Acidimicrobiales bacterium]